MKKDDQARLLFRNYIYDPKWEAFFVAAMDAGVSDDAVLALLPKIVDVPTLHCDSGTALLSLTKHIAWDRTSCAKHMQPNIMPLCADLKELAMQLLYCREISTHVAFEIRDHLFSEMYKVGAASQSVKKWVTANFESDEAMQVRVHML